MKFTETFFDLPVRVFDDIQVSKAIRNDEEDGIDWLIGRLRISLEESQDLKWQDYFSHVSISEAAKAKEAGGLGLDCTLVILRGGQQYICPWSRTMFEGKLNTYLEKMYASSKTETTDETEEEQKDN